MKKQILHLVVSITIIGALTMSALANLDSPVSVNIPFTFNVNGVTLEAGKYQIRQLGIAGMLAIKSADHKQNFSFRTLNDTVRPSNGKTRLLFHRYGQQYFLSEIQDGNSGASHQLFTSKAERAAARPKTDHLARNIQPELVTVSVQ